MGVITDKLANKLFGSANASIGQIIKLSGGLPFTVVGVFKESVDTFGQSEIQEDTMLIPYTVSRFFTPTGASTRSTSRQRVPRMSVPQRQPSSEFCNRAIVLNRFTAFRT